MIADLSWLAQEAQNLHQFFEKIFYMLITVFLLIAVVLEYFKFPLGGMPSFITLVGRVFVAALLLHGLPEIMDAISMVTNSITEQLGDLHSIKRVLSRLGDKMDELTWSWLSIKDIVITGISFLTFFGLYLSVFIAEAFILFAWTFLYVLSPILIAFFVFPQTSGVTATFFRSLIEISCWKIVWSILATLLWSTALSKINQTDINFLTVVCFNIILAGSILFTPQIVKGLAGSGITGLGSMITGSALYAAGGMAMKGARVGGQAYNQTLSSANQRFKGSWAQKNILSKAPMANVKPPKPYFVNQHQYKHKYQTNARRKNENN